MTKKKKYSIPTSKGKTTSSSTRPNKGKPPKNSIQVKKKKVKMKSNRM
jgi:hypothetical protein